ncbi:MAG: hypothetical protein Q4F05_17840 [bacterium]|nr:hypothetical protein [bacterium]
MQVTRNKLYQFVCGILTLALAMSILTGCSNNKSGDLNNTPVTPGNLTEDNNDAGTDKQITKLPLDTVMMTVNDKEYTLGDLMYVIYYLEKDYSSTAIGFLEQYGIDFWNDIYDENTNETGSDIVRKSMMETAAMIAVLPQVAKEAGYTCDAAEIEEIEEEADMILTDLPKENLERTGFTKEYLVEIMKTFSIVNQYVQDQINAQKVDEDKIRATVDPNSEENKQVMLQYIFLGTLDEEENHIGAEETTALIKKGKSMLEDVQAGKDMEEVCNNATSASETNIYYNEEAILNADLEKEMVRAVSECKEGELYDSLVETDKGYYLFRLVSNNATDAYENNVAEAIYEAKKEAYNKSYEEMLDKYTITQNEEEWEKLVLGSYAYSEIEASSDGSGMATEDEFFDLSGLTGGSETGLPDDTADGDDGSVG